MNDKDFSALSFDEVKDLARANDVDAQKNWIDRKFSELQTEINQPDPTLRDFSKIVHLVFDLVGLLMLFPSIAASPYFTPQLKQFLQELTNNTRLGFWVNCFLEWCTDQRRKDAGRIVIAFDRLIVAIVRWIS